MRAGLLFTFILVLTATAQQLPRIEGTNLLDQKVELPEAAGGHAAVLVLGFTHASQHEVKPWAAKLTPLHPTWQVAVLQDVPRLVRGMVEHGIKSGTPADQRGHFLMAFHGEKELKDAAGFSAPDDAYVLVIDGSGAIRFKYHGAVTDSALGELQRRMAELR